MGRPTGAHVSGPLQPLVGGFLFELIELGYSWTAQMARLRLMAELSAWMAARGVGLTELTQALLEEFLEKARPGVGEGVVLANVRAAAAGLLAGAGLGGGA